MKRAFFALIVAALIALSLFAGCTPQSGSSPLDPQENSGQASTGRLRHITDSYGFPSGETREGYYMVEQNGTGFFINYIDFESRQKTVLCNKPECTHSNDACPANLSRNAYVFEGDACLYIWYNESDGDDKDSLARIERMDYDGSNRKTVYTFDKMVDIINRGMAIDGNLLYAVFSYGQVDGAGNYSASYKFETIDLNTGKETVLLDLETQLYLLGVSDNGFIFKEFSIDEDYESKGEKHTLYFYDRADPTLRKLTQWYQEEKVGIVKGDQLFSYDPVADILEQYDLLSQQGKTVCKDLGFNDTHVYCFGKFDDYLLFSHENLELQREDVLAVNCITGEKTVYTRQYPRSDTVQFCEPILVHKGRVLAITAVTKEDQITKDQEGNVISVSMDVFHYSLIPTDDFFHNKDTEKEDISVLQ